MAKKNQSAKLGFGTDVNTPEDAIHMGTGKKIRLEDVPEDSATGDKQVGNREYNDARYQSKGESAVTVARFLEGGFWIYSGEGLIFNAVKTVYELPGVVVPITVNAAPRTINLADVPNSDTLPFYACPQWDSEGVLSILYGVASADPIVPSVADPLTQIAGNPVFIGAGATSIPPEQIQTTVIYNENTEFAMSYTGSGSANYNNTVFPESGLKSANISSLQNDSTIIATAAADFYPLDFDAVALKIRLKEIMLFKFNVRVQFFNNAGVAVSNAINLPINKNLVGEYQQVAIGIADFAFSSTLARQIRLTWNRGSGSSPAYLGYYFDAFVLQGGVIPPIVQGTIQLTGQVVGSGVTGAPIQTTLTEKAISDQAEVLTPNMDSELLIRTITGVLAKLKLSNLGYQKNNIVKVVEINKSALSGTGMIEEQLSAYVAANPPVIILDSDTSKYNVKLKDDSI